MSQLSGHFLTRGILLGHTFPTCWPNLPGIPVQVTPHPSFVVSHVRDSVTHVHLPSRLQATYLQELLLFYFLL